MIRIQLADDHELVLNGLHAVLHGQPDLTIVEPTIRSGKGILDHVATAQPDILLLDVGMPEFQLFSVLRQLKARGPKPWVFILSACADFTLVKECAAAGVAGYALKDEAISKDLPNIVRSVAAGRKWFSPGASAYLVPHAIQDQLSAQQLAVLQLMAQGKLPNEIAAELQRSQMLVYKVQENIRDKLGVETNEQAILAALRERLVSFTNN